MSTLALAPAGILTYANAASRDAALTPRIGQGVFLIDSGSVLFYFGKYLGWRPPWNVAWGVVARTEAKTDALTYTTYEDEIVGARTTFTAVAGRQYRINVELVFQPANSAGQDYTTFGVFEQGDLIDVRRAIIGETGTNVETLVKFNVSTTFAVGVGAQQTKTILVKCSSAHLGGVTIDAGAYPVVVTVDDVGPNANPIYK